MSPVSQEKWREVRARMQRVGMQESDLDERFIRGSGKGGQKINKTSVAVQLRHRPSGLTALCQEGRSQAMNRFLARRRLVEKLEARSLEEKSVEQQRREKIRRQKRRRSRRAKEKMLAGKKIQAEKKTWRRKVHPV